MSPAIPAMPSSFFLTETATVERPTGVGADQSGAPRNSGGFVAVLALSDIPCSRQPATSKTVFLFAQRQMLVTDEIYFAGDVGIIRGDRLTFGSDGKQIIVVGFLDEAYQGRVFVVCGYEMR